MKKTLYILILFVIFSSFGKPVVGSYISKYKDIAISEMEDTGVPASITIAQGILESRCGTSPVAVKNKNHFGIKAGKNKYKRFNTVEDSFRDHSKILSKYKSCLKGKDYVRWAKGLSKNGYCKEPQYSSDIISIIKKYKLYALDA